MLFDKDGSDIYIFDEFRDRTNHLPKDISAEEFKMFADYIEEQFGFILGEDKFDSLRISLHARANQLGVKSYKEYFQIIKDNIQELKELLSLITINETYFFRYPEQFQVLGNIILPELLISRRYKKERPLRIWSAGCSTGEEAFSIAITIMESIPDWQSLDIKILGTDVSKKALEAAFKGIYPRSAFRITREEIIEKYFIKVDKDHWRIKDEVRSLVDFMYHNLIKEPYPFAFIGARDIIFCRNVTIYFKPESTRRVIKNFYQSLVPGGYLFIGHSETLYNLNPGFLTVRYGDVFLYQKPHEAQENDSRINTEDLKSEKHKAILSESAQAKIDIDHIPASSRDVNEKIKSTSESNNPCADVRTKKILFLLERDRIADAKSEVDSLISSDPLNPEAYYLSGIISKKMGFLEDALEAFRRSVYLDKDFAPSLIEIGSIYYTIGNLDESVKYYWRAAETLKRTGGRKFLDHKGGEINKFLEGICKEMIKRIQQEKVT